MPNPTSANHQITSVQRAFELLRSFKVDQPELSVTELSRSLHVHKSTISRLLATLHQNRIVNRNPENGKYRLGIGLLELAGCVMLHADLRQTARPFMRQLSEMTQETVNLAVLESGESVNIEQAVSYERHVTGIGWLGRRSALHATSTGKVLFAFLSAAEQDRLIQIPLTKYTENTITDPRLLQIELSKIRESGYANGLEELEIGLNAVAAPVFDHSGQVIAALSVTGPSPRLSFKKIEEQVASQVVDAAARISQAVGFVIISKQ